MSFNSIIQTATKWYYNNQKGDDDRSETTSLLASSSRSASSSSQALKLGKQSAQITTILTICAPHAVHKKHKFSYTDSYKFCARILDNMGHLRCLRAEAPSNFLVEWSSHVESMINTASNPIDYTGYKNKLGKLKDNECFLMSIPTKYYQLILIHKLNDSYAVYYFKPLCADQCENETSLEFQAQNICVIPNITKRAINQFIVDCEVDLKSFDKITARDENKLNEKFKSFIKKLGAEEPSLNPLHWNTMPVISLPNRAPLYLLRMMLTEESFNEYQLQLNQTATKRLFQIFRNSLEHDLNASSRQSFHAAVACNDLIRLNRHTGDKENSELILIKHQLKTTLSQKSDYFPQSLAAVYSRYTSPLLRNTEYPGLCLQAICYSFAHREYKTCRQLLEELYQINVPKLQKDRIPELANQLAQIFNANPDRSFAACNLACGLIRLFDNWGLTEILCKKHPEYNEMFYQQIIQYTQSNTKAIYPESPWANDLEAFINEVFLKQIKLG